MFSSSSLNSRQYKAVGAIKIRNQTNWNKYQSKVSTQAQNQYPGH